MEMVDSFDVCEAKPRSLSGCCSQGKKCCKSWLSSAWLNSEDRLFGFLQIEERNRGFIDTLQKLKRMEQINVILHPM
jgi:hypothetical protein